MVERNESGELIFENGVRLPETEVYPAGTYFGRSVWLANEENYFEDYRRKRFFAMIRRGKSPIQSILVNYFGECGGFEWVLKRIESGAPIEVVVNLVAGIGNMAELLFVKFVDEFARPFTEAILNNVQGL